MARRRRGENPGFFYRLRTTDRRMQGIIIGAFLAMIMMTFVPGFYPVTRNGAECTDLAQPLGGNNRSVLAYRSEQIDAVDLDLDLESRTIGPNSPLRIVLTFRNEDRGPVILHIPNQDPIITSDPATQGITFRITSADNTVAVGNQPTTYAPPGVFAGDALKTLHLLGSRSRCHETITFDAALLTSLGLIPGRDYRIQAFYTNTSDGDLLAAIPPGATATPFPEYANSQGVWVGTASSEEIRFTISTVQDTIPAQ